MSLEPKHVEAFGFVIGVEKRVFKDQDPVNILAAELMGKLHDALKASGYAGPLLERLLVRLLFCLFADDTGIYDGLGLFETFLRDRTREDGSDLGPLLAQFFQVLNTPPAARQVNLDEDLARFPFINGDLFAAPLPIPSFDKAMRDRLLEACGFSWEKISPAIFGALFQSVMNARERRAKGAHYTTEKNILKVIEPLFLDDLRTELARMVRLKRGRDQALRSFQDRLAALKLFDPACGCGNFLIIAYRELRALEIEVLKALYPEGQRDLEASALSLVDVDQFYGIEIDEFPARIAETAMWMMDHIMNNRLSLEFGQVFARIPLRAAPHIIHADALEIDWAGVLAPEECSFVFGNPPFAGQSYQSPAQRSQMGRIVDTGGRGGSLDYVAAWFLKAAAFIRGATRVAFVATNSITQGEQVAQLWPLLFQRGGLEISFAHRTFAWGSDARGIAHVHVVIIGLARRGYEPVTKRLFSYSDVNGAPVESQHNALSPYLIDAARLGDPHLVVRDETRPPNSVPPMRMGSKLVDDGHYIFTEDEKIDFLTREPGAAALMRPLMGSVEFINGLSRWILYVADTPPEALRRLPSVVDRIAAVRQYRSASRKPKTRQLANSPTKFEVTTVPTRPYLAIPKVSSERRAYLPIGWLEPPILPSQLVQVLLDATTWEFGLLTSAMHMAWLRQVGGRMKSDYQYSIGLVYNCFPWPTFTPQQRQQVEQLAQQVLEARATYPEATLADLYDPDVMPVELRRAHQALDLAVDRLYRRLPFTSERERVEHLFSLYEKIATGLLASAGRKPRGGSKKRVP